MLPAFVLGLVGWMLQLVGGFIFDFADQCGNVGEAIQKRGLR